MTSDTPMILIAEDAPTQAMGLKFLLENQNYRVTIARDGEEALRLIPLVKPQLIITDIVMPKLDGYQLCQEVKKHPQFKNIPVILLTSLTEVTDVIKGLECGADNFVTKPFNNNYFLARVNYVLKEMSAVKNESHEDSIKIEYSGHSFSIKADRLQIINILLSVFDAAIQRNYELIHTKNELKAAYGQLEENLMKVNEMNEELEKFCSCVSHDLRAPLRAVTRFGTLLLEEYGKVLDDKAKGYLLGMTNSAQHMKTLIEALLSLSMLTQHEVRPDDVNLTKIAERIIDELTKLEPERKVTVSIAQNAIQRGDNDLLQSVLDNLLRNAWKFTSKNPDAAIEFGFSSMNDETTYYVKDNGAGFDMKYVEKLFSPFQRLHASSEFEGTGIGLATVQRIIHRHKGKVWVTGEVGKGATFYFKLFKMNEK
ncbi:MAG: response regulator [Bdellovibrionia bacterium]